MSDSTKLISILIPVYNTARYLDKCLRSARGQTYGNIEILVVNDGSTDDSMTIAEAHAKHDIRLRVFSKANGGLSSARNYAIRQARGEYLLHVDSDDWIEPDCVEKLVSKAAATDADMVICDIVKDYRKKSRIMKEPYPEMTDFESFLDLFALKNGLGSVWNKLIRRELYVKNGIWHLEDISLGEDSTALLRLAACARRIIHVPEALYHYNCSSSGMSQVLKKNVMEYYAGLRVVSDFYRVRNIAAGNMPMVRLKVAYVQLAYCSLGKARRMGYADYPRLARLFKQEINEIAASKDFRRLNVKYRLFVLGYRVYLSALHLLKKYEL